MEVFGALKTSSAQKVIDILRIKSTGGNQSVRLNCILAYAEIHPAELNQNLVLFTAAGNKTLTTTMVTTRQLESAQNMAGGVLLQYYMHFIVAAISDSAHVAFVQARRAGDKNKRHTSIRTHGFGCLMALSQISRAEFSVFLRKTCI